MDPLAAAVAFAVLGPMVAGPAMAYGLRFLPPRWRHTAQWLTIGSAVVVAVLAEALRDEGSGAGVVVVYLLIALPGLLTFLVWRSLLASLLVSLAPMYFVIAILTRDRPTFAPEIALDRAIGVQPAWMLVYGSLYMFVVVLPLLVVREPGLIRRAMQSYLFVMMVSYAGFLLYPTAAPRVGDAVPGAGFAAWTLRLMYSVDAPYNCFPSLHVAYAFVSALACYRVHRGVGTAAAAWAVLIGISTVYTKQHYVVDVIGGAVAAGVAYVLFLRPHSREAVPLPDRQGAPARAVWAIAAFAIMVAGFQVAYRIMIRGG
jgi:membrane-associated phospholipid phosphatase